VWAGLLITHPSSSPLASAQLKADRADASAELTSKTLQDLPFTLGRNYQNLFRTPPGVTPQEDEGQKSQPNNLMPHAFF
jgi:hypothetical protein